MPPILFLVFQNNVRANGGVESITQILAHLQAPNATVITQLETPHTQRWRDLGLTTFVWPLSFEAGRASRGLGNIVTRVREFLRYNARVALFVRRQRVAVVHCNDILSLYLGGVGAKLAGAKIVHNLRDIKQPHARYGLRWKITGWIANVTLTLSGEMARAAETRFLRKGAHSTYIYSIVAPDMRLPTEQERKGARGALGLEAGARVVSVVASLVAKKNQATLIERCAGDLTKKCQLAFVGDGDPSYSDLCHRAAAPFGNAIVFPGHSKTIREWYWASDIVLLASEHEGLARCMIEAVSCGTPVVSFDVCSAREILAAHQCGVVVPQGDYAGLITAVLGVLGDDNRRRRLGENGARLRGELFEPRKVAASYREFYTQIGSGRGHACT